MSLVNIVKQQLLGQSVVSSVNSTGSAGSFISFLRRSPLRNLAGGVFALVLIIGGLAAFRLSQQSQDVRQQAKTVNCASYNNKENECTKNGCNWDRNPDTCTDSTTPGCRLDQCSNPINCGGVTRLEIDQKCTNANLCIKSDCTFYNPYCTNPKDDIDCNNRSTVCEWDARAGVCGVKSDAAQHCNDASGCNSTFCSQSCREEAHCITIGDGSACNDPRCAKIFSGTPTTGTCTSKTISPSPTPKPGDPPATPTPSSCAHWCASDQAQCTAAGGTTTEGTCSGAKEVCCIAKGNGWIGACADVCYGYNAAVPGSMGCGSSTVTNVTCSEGKMTFKNEAASCVWSDNPIRMGLALYDRKGDISGPIKTVLMSNHSDTGFMDGLDCSKNYSFRLSPQCCNPFRDPGEVGSCKSCYRDVNYTPPTATPTPTPTATPTATPTPPSCVSWETVKLNNCTFDKWSANPMNPDCVVNTTDVNNGWSVNLNYSGPTNPNLYWQIKQNIPNNIFCNDPSLSWGDGASKIMPITPLTLKDSVNSKVCVKITDQSTNQSSVCGAIIKLQTPAPTPSAPPSCISMPLSNDGAGSDDAPHWNNASDLFDVRAYFIDNRGYDNLSVNLECQVADTQWEYLGTSNFSTEFTFLPHVVQHNGYRLYLPAGTPFPLIKLNPHCLTYKKTSGVANFRASIKDKDGKIVSTPCQKEIRTSCGDNVVDVGEECDETSAFCVSCKWKAPMCRWSSVSKVAPNIGDTVNLSCDVSTSDPIGNFYRFQITNPAGVVETIDGVSNAAGQPQPYSYLVKRAGEYIIKCTSCINRTVAGSPKKICNEF